MSALSTAMDRRVFFLLKFFLRLQQDPFAHSSSLFVYDMLVNVNVIYYVHVCVIY